jgi:hypothetical protein
VGSSHTEDAVTASIAAAAGIPAAGTATTVTVATTVPVIANPIVVVEAFVVVAITIIVVATGCRHGYLHCSRKHFIRSGVHFVRSHHGHHRIACSILRVFSR